MKYLYSLIILTCSLTSLYAGAITSNGTGGGVWSAGSTWVGGIAPTKGDTVTIASGDTVTVDTAFDIGTNVAASTCLTINGVLDYPYTVNSGTWNFRGRIQLQDGYTPVASTIDASNVWNASTSTFMTSGTFGYNAGVILGSIPDDIDTSSNTIVTAMSGISISTTSVAEGVWDALTSTHTTSGSFGQKLKKLFNSFGF